MKCYEIMQILQELSPQMYAMDWDNVGLLVGRKDQEVNKIMIALDATEEVVDKAVEQGVDMIVTHHPMLFRSIKQVTDGTAIGRKILKLAENHIAYFAMHTNFDIKGSMAELAADRIGLIDAEVLEVTYENDGTVEGIGRIGNYEGAISVAELAERVKKEFHMDTVMLYGDSESMVQRIAISPGSGRSMVKEALRKDADVLITGDFGHHEGLDAVEDGLQIIDATHYGLEHIFIEFIENYLAKRTVGIELIPCATGCPCKFM